MPFTPPKDLTPRDMAWIITRSLFFIIMTGVSLICVTGSAMMMGLVSYIALGYVREGVPLIVAITLFFSGMAGREYFLGLLWKMLFSDAETKLYDAMIKK